MMAATKHSRWWLHFDH